MDNYVKKNAVNYDGHLLIYSETHVDVIDCFTGDWVQTLNLKRCLPLNHNGLLSASFATEQPYVVYLRNINKGKSISTTQALTVLNFNVKFIHFFHSLRRR